MPARKLTLNSGDTLPVQHREYKIDKSKVDAENRTVEILFSTDDPAERWFGDEILDHSPGACDLRRLNDGGAFLKDHDSRQQIGVHESASISVVAVGSKQRGEGRAVVRFAPSTNQLAEQEFQDMMAGVRTKISVGYIAREMKLIEEDDDGNETWLVTKWEPLENSLVAIPLDPACAAGRGMEGDKKFPVAIDTSFRNIENNRTDAKNKVDGDNNESHKRETTTSMETPAASEPKVKSQADLDAEKREREQFLKDERTADRERQKEIRAIAKRGNKVPDEVVEKAIDDETSADAFRKLVFEKYFGNAETIDTPAGNGNGDIRVLGECGNGKTQSIGREFVTSEAFKRAIQAKGQGERVMSLDFPISMLGIRGKAAMSQRAGFVSSDLAPINVQIQQNIIGLGVNPLTVMDLIAPGTTGAAAVIYPRENTFGTVDGVAVSGMPRGKTVGERGVKPIWEPDLTTETAPVKKVAITTKVPDEFVNDFQQAESFINERLPFMVDTETEFQILYGDGLGNNLKGITSVGGIQTRAYATTWADTARKAITDIRVNSFFEPTGFAFNPLDWEVASLEKDANGQYLAGGPFYAPYGTGMVLQFYTYWGKPVAVSTAVTVGKPIVGCWKLGAQYFIREGMRLEMTNANEDDFRRNLIMFRAEHRLALAVYRPVAFLEITGGPART